jgi:hypothetical protein
VGERESACPAERRRQAPRFTTGGDRTEKPDSGVECKPVRRDYRRTGNHVRNTRPEKKALLSR